jgi:hypothetical protein
MRAAAPQQRFALSGHSWEYGFFVKDDNHD